METTLWGYFPDIFLPGPSPWKKPFLGTLVALPLLLALLSSLALYYISKQRQSQGMHAPQDWFCSEEHGGGDIEGHPGKYWTPEWLMEAPSCPGWNGTKKWAWEDI
jgi:hypothetical protein